MSAVEALATVRYITDAEGNKTDVLMPLATWEALVADWQEMAERLEDQDDAAIARDWLQRRMRGEAAMITLDQLEQELIADGLLPS